MDQFSHLMNKLEHEVMIITGEPGSGKTTLMRYLAKEWAEGRILQFCQIVLLVHLGTCKKEYKTLSDLLECAGHEDVKQVAQIILGNHGKEACFLLDAYDEKSTNGDFVDSLVNSNDLHVLSQRGHHMPIN